MEPYSAILIPIFLSTLLASLGWMLNRMVKLSEAVVKCIDKVEAINVEQHRLNERVDNLIMQHWTP